MFPHLCDSSYLVNISMFLLELFKKSPSKEKELLYALCARDSDVQHRFITKEDNNSDNCSTNSFSTMATMDNNPGTGRVLDLYFFQPAGRGIERLAMRLSIRYLHPTRILAYIDGVSA